MSIIYASNLKDVQNLYDLENYKVNKKSIETSLQEIKRRYSKKFAKLLKKMIAKTEAKRISLKGIKKRLKKRLKKLSMQNVSGSDEEGLIQIVDDE